MVKGDLCFEDLNGCEPQCQTRCETKHPGGHASCDAATSLWAAHGAAIAAHGAAITTHCAAMAAKRRNMQCGHIFVRWRLQRPVL
ncbi:hypothetical protein TIFTF001_039074 [Ficus carica]|uniref:Uncharacterized protein n=1 Tax=Ficus carica TaxID=3494 RepID=A0AA88E945_FICCA|nr:hypothetical protein TIFTF001_039074 [Ficus carica]